jgi:lysophospholipase L1-like esterase
MRIGVLGNSDTTGQKLQPGEDSWPVLLRARLTEALGAPVIVDSWKFAAYRPGAVDFAMRLVDEAQPDVVIVTLASCWCAFGTVQSSVEQRFGPAAGKLARNAERKLGVVGRNPLPRKVARKVVGTGTLMSVDSFVHVYSNLIRELAKREDMQVLVMEDHHFTRALRERMPAISDALPRIVAGIQPLVLDRRMHWARVEDAIAVGGRRDEMFLDDDVHMKAEAHGRMAAALTDLVLPMAAQRAPTGSFASSAKPS